MFTIKNENQLHFLDYFDDKINFMKKFLLGFVKLQSTYLSFVSFAQMRKDLKEKRSHKYFLPSQILSHGQQV